MKQKHILNVGHAKCATTWLWVQLSRHPALDIASLPKEPFDFLETLDFDRYCSTYKDLDVSANFHVMTWCLDQDLIRLMNQVTTHATIMLSDPFLFINRQYKWIPSVSLSPSEFVDMCIDTKFICYQQIAQRWINNLDPGKFKILLYDDLVNKPRQFLSDYLNFVGLEDLDIVDYDQHQNVNTDPLNADLTFTSTQIQLVNQEIDKFQQLIGRDLTHWKK